MPDRSISALLQENAAAIGPVLPVDLNASHVCVIDLTEHNTTISDFDIRDTEQFNNLVQHLLHKQQATIGIGGYLEDRVIYRRSEHFNAAENRRTVHLGVDVWLPPLAPVMAPIDARVHSFRNNNNFGDYGPTIILEHTLGKQTLFTLYGHLTSSSLTGLQVGQVIKQGEIFTQVGPYPENGDWPPHLHFQVITDLLGMAGDFPGVCTREQKEKFAAICINPNLLLKSKYLG